MKEDLNTTMEPSSKASSLRWRILRQSFLRRPPQDPSETSIRLISRKATHGFNLIPFHSVKNIRKGNIGSSEEPNGSESSSRDVCLCYTVPIPGTHELHLYQRVDDQAILDDFEICNRYNIDNTGLVFEIFRVCDVGGDSLGYSFQTIPVDLYVPGSWPSEDVLAYYCLTHADIFRSKRVIELGSGYGLAGLVIAAFTEASEVVISDGNPRVVDYIQRSINVNTSAFGDKLVKSMTLHWDQRETSFCSNSFDLIVASDCTFFKDFHKGLAQTVKFLLKKDAHSRALFFSPKRGDSLDKFLIEISDSGLHFSVDEIYDNEIWSRHQQFLNSNDDAWPNYEKDHCYPLLVTITF